MGGKETMGSQGGDEIVDQEPKWQPLLGRQGSFYRLTLDEVENQLQLGGDLGSMNMEDLLNSVRTADANHDEPSRPNEPAIRDIGKKTVDEVWREIQFQQHNSRTSSDNGGNHETRRDQGRQASLGEMTLEDFLAKAGVSFESGGGGGGGGGGVDPIIQPQQHEHAEWMMQCRVPTSLHQHQAQDQQQQQQSCVMGLFMKKQQPLPAARGESNQISESLVIMSPSYNLMGALSDTQTPARKRVAPGNVVEKTVERRQKRMIKNRESAARSRARRQAYTHELENKVLLLEEENERLKRQRDVEKVFPCVLPPEPKFQLRRTRSTSF